MAHDKVRFSRLLDEVALPHPGIWFARSAQELQDMAAFPCVIKIAMGTASRGKWMERDQADLALTVAELQR